MASTSGSWRSSIFVPPQNDFISGIAGCSNDANESVEGRDSGLSFLSFIHYAVGLGLFVTQTDVTASSSEVPRFDTAIVLDTLYFLGG
jgi:hypothetical protein